jgi:hypothetical protein
MSRAAEAMTDTTPLNCWNCGAAQTALVAPPTRHDFCSACGEALHCCRQCTSFDRSAPGQCREPRAEPPTDRESANFCEWFAAVSGAAKDRSAADAARAKLEALFGPKEPDGG